MLKAPNHYSIFRIWLLPISYWVFIALYCIFKIRSIGNLDQYAAFFMTLELKLMSIFFVY